MSALSLCANIFVCVCICLWLCMCVYACVEHVCVCLFERASSLCVFVYWLVFECATLVCVCVCVCSLTLHSPPPGDIHTSIAKASTTLGCLCTKVFCPPNIESIPKSLYTKPFVSLHPLSSSHTAASGSRSDTGALHALRTTNTTPPPSLSRTRGQNAQPWATTDKPSSAVSKHSAGGKKIGALKTSQKP